MNTGYDPKKVKPIFKEGATRLEKKSIIINIEKSKVIKKSTLLPHQELYFHPVHHSKDVSRKTIQEVYKETCGPILRELLDV